MPRLWRTDSPAADELWTTRTALRRAREVLRDDGLGTLAVKLAGETVYRRLALYGCDLASLPAARRTSVALLDEAAADEYVAFRPDETTDVVRARLRSGHRCFVAHVDGRLVGARWVATDRVLIDALGWELQLSPGDAFGYRLYTAPDLRGRGLATTLRLGILQILREEGRRRGLSAILPENRAGIRVAEKTGERRIGTLGVVRLGRHRRPVIRMLDGNRPPGSAAV